jgi:selenocysteine lyase/cysteine desulfurase
MPWTYFNAASTHPLPLGACTALEAYGRHKTLGRTAPDLDMPAMDRRVMGLFAGLVGASLDELSFTQSTSMAENLVLNALGLVGGGGRIVTDALHFAGSLYTYAKAAEAGVEVVMLPMQPGGGVDMDAFESAIDARTTLVAISLVSSVNGYEHDLKRICEVAHARGALVYADIIHAAGAMPLDLHATGVDFAACASYKWLMGDFGLAFLYARRGVQDRLKPSWWGYYQTGSLQDYEPLVDPAAWNVDAYDRQDNAAGLFAMGTMCRTGVAMLNYSLDWIDRVGTDAIQTYRQPLLDAIQVGLRQRGYRPLTPMGSRSPILCFALPDAPAKLEEPLRRHRLKLAVAPDRFRISVAAFNDREDVERLLHGLPASPE